MVRPRCGHATCRAARTTRNPTRFALTRRARVAAAAAVAAEDGGRPPYGAPAAPRRAWPRVSTRWRRTPQTAFRFLHDARSRHARLRRAPAAGGAEERRDVQRQPGELRHVDELAFAGSDLHVKGASTRSLALTQNARSMPAACVLGAESFPARVRRTATASGACRCATCAATPSSTCASLKRCARTQRTRRTKTQNRVP
jgi:hypothetical protein